MKWFRRHIKTGSRLALFALAIQLALSFGHFHFDTAHAGPAVQIGLSDVDLSSVDGVLPAETSQQPSDHHDHDPHPSADCAACVLLSLAGNLLLSTPPVLLLPDAIELLLLATDAEFAHLNSARLPFQSRAPPLS
jgi:hypothetical protein